MALPNCPEFVISFFAIQKLGAVVVNVGPLMGADDLQHGHRDDDAARRDRAGPSAPPRLHAARRTRPLEHFVWVIASVYQTLLKRLGYQFKLWQDRRNGAARARPQHMMLNDLWSTPRRGRRRSNRTPDATAVLQPTGGTTGTSSSPSSRTATCWPTRCRWRRGWAAAPGQERVLTVLPMFHVYGLTTGPDQSVFCAATMILMTRFDAARRGAAAAPSADDLPVVPAICDAISDRDRSRKARRETAGASRSRTCGSASAAPRRCTRPPPSGSSG